MSITVYPRLDELLESSNVTIAELESQIEGRFGLAVDQTTLHTMLMGDEPVKRVDLDSVAAVAAILQVPLSDLFVVETSSDGGNIAENSVLGPEDSRRMAELFARQDCAALSETESVELDDLVVKYGRLLHERQTVEIAEKRGVPLEQVQRESEAAVAEALDWWHTFNADPRNREGLAERVKQRRAGQTERQTRQSG